MPSTGSKNPFPVDGQVVATLVIKTGASRAELLQAHRAGIHLYDYAKSRQAGYTHAEVISQHQIKQVKTTG